MFLNPPLLSFCPATKRKQKMPNLYVLVRLFAGNGHCTFVCALLGELRLQKYDLLFALVLITPILRRKAGLFILLALITSSAEIFSYKGGRF